jgi:hypothetical protein
MPEYGELPKLMKSKFLMSVCWVIVVAVPLLGQDRLYPVRESRDVPALLTADRSAFVVEKSFQYRLTLGFPTDDQAAILPDTRSPIVLLWLKIQNVSDRPIEVNTAKFTSTDEQGRVYSALAPDEASNRIVAGASGGSLGTKTLRGISLGRVANKPTEDQLKEDILRYSLASGEIPPRTAREGLIYFEEPERKKFNVSIVLGDLWSKPLVFSTEKQK